ncbi:hypothetical protein Tco_1054853 [Tanacetum coccineum]|uniref:Uncharacterized protein n=1 Tax=Tanacetum coccineum TaxID=301880 RepID=A0ABQ5GXZ7_9ASTR
MMTLKTIAINGTSDVSSCVLSRGALTLSHHQYTATTSRGDSSKGRGGLEHKGATLRDASIVAQRLKITSRENLDSFVRTSIPAGVKHHNQYVDQITENLSSWKAIRKHVTTLVFSIMLGNGSADNGCNMILLMADRDRNKQRTVLLALSIQLNNLSPRNCIPPECLLAEYQGNRHDRHLKKLLVQSQNPSNTPDPL